jgi:putative transposase
MARKARVEFSGNLFHVIARGKRRALLFHDDADYRTYLARLRQSQRRDELVCNTHVLMSNHVLLLAEKGGDPLVADFADPPVYV